MKPNRPFAISAVLFIATASQAADIGTTYARQLEVQRQEAWLARQLRVYRAYPHLDRANRLLEKGSLPGARTELERALVIDPHDLRTRLELAMVLQRSRQYSDERAQCDLMLADSPGNVPALLYKGLALDGLRRNSAAIEAFRAAADSPAIQPQDREFALDALADLYYRTGDYTQSAATLRALGQTRNSFDTHYRLAETLLAAKDLAGAAGEFRTARGLAKSSEEITQSSNGLANLGIATRDWKTADNGLTSLIEKNPTNPTYLAQKAEVSYQEGDYQQADLWARMALKSGATPEARLHLTKLLTETSRRLRNWPDVKQSLLDVLELNPKDGEILRALAQGSWVHKDTKEAAHWGERALATTNAHTDREFLANAYLALDRYRDAIPLLQQALKESRTPAEQHRLAGSLGAALEHEGLDREAAALYRVYPSPDFAFREALAYSRLGQEDLELDHLNAAIAGDLKPSQLRIAREMRGFILLRRGDSAKAKEDLAAGARLGKPEPASLLALAQLDLKDGNFQGAADFARRALAVHKDAYAQRLLAEAEIRAGHIDLALPLYRELAASGNREQQAGFLAAIANLESQRHNLSAAAASYEAAYHRGGDVDWKLLEQASQAYFMAGDIAKAEETGTRFLALSQPSSAEKAVIEEQLGYARLKLGHDEAGIQFLASAVARGRKSAVLQADLGYALVRLQRWDPALDHLRAANDLAPAGALQLQIAAIYQKLGKPGLAIPFLRQALGPGSRITDADRLQAWNTLGFLYFDEKQYGPAVESWRQLAALQPDNMTNFRIARALRLSGKLDEAQAALGTVQPFRENPADFYDERAALALAQNRLNDAYADARRANEMASSPMRSFILGDIALKLKKTREAASYLEGAYDADPTNIAFAESLAYADLELKRYPEAARLLQQVVKQDPNAARVYADLAYAQKHLDRNREAADSFKHAIDYARLPGNGGDTRPLQQEVSQLSDSVSLTLYQSYSSGSRNSVATQAGAVPSQGGALVTWTPPVIGFRDGRILQVYARTFFSDKPHSLAIDTASPEAGLGVRYKPLANANIAVGAERLFAIGGNALQAWMIHTEGGWQRGESLRHGRSRWNYTSLYADVARFINRNSFNAVYGEGRQGVSFNFHDRMILTPHVVTDFRYENPSRYIGSYAEGGGGISLRILTGENRYRLHRAEYEFLAQYKAGSFMHPPTGISARSFNGFVVSGSARF